MLLRPTRLVALSIGTAMLLTPTVAAAGTAPTDEVEDAALLLLLDASRSMEDPDAQGEPKIDAARAALHDVIDGLDPSQSVGLRVFGGAVPLDRPRAQKCADSELVVPVGADNTEALSAAVDDYAPLGETPIAHALQQAGQDLAHHGQRTIVLVSDGIATCDPDPCEVAEDLQRDGLDLVVHTVGLGADEQTRTQLQCIAEAGGGSYHDAADAESLTSVLTQVSTRAFRPFTITGTPVAGAISLADAPALAPGQYVDTLAKDEANAKLYRLPRTAPGATLHVGVTMRPERPGASDFQLRLETPSGAYCGGEVGRPWSAGGGHSFGTTSLSSADRGTEGPCQEEDELVLRLYAGTGSDRIAGAPMEIVVVEEPPVTNAAALPGQATEPEWQGPVPTRPVGTVVPGTSLNDAPLIEPGRTYSSELTRGEIVFFRVPVEHGQRLEALAEFPRPTGLLAQTTGPVSDIADIMVVGPTRGVADAVLADLGDLSRRAILQEDRAVRAATTTHEVRWANRSHSNAEEASLAGDYYIGVSMTSSEDLLLPMPFTLTTQLVGEVSGVPEYASAEDLAAQDDVAADTADATTGPTDVAAAPSDTTGTGAEAAGPTDGDGGRTWLPWALGAGGVLVAGAGAALLGWRRA